VCDAQGHSTHSTHRSWGACVAQSRGSADASGGSADASSVGSANASRGSADASSGGSADASGVTAHPPMVPPSSEACSRGVRSSGHWCDSRGDWCDGGGDRCDSRGDWCDSGVPEGCTAAAICVPACPPSAPPCPDARSLSQQKVWAVLATGHSDVHQANNRLPAMRLWSL